MGTITDLEMNMQFPKKIIKSSYVSAAAMQAQPVLDAFYESVVACGRQPPFKPTIQVAMTPGSMRYDPVGRAIIIIPYDVLQPVQRTAVERFAAVGTLGLSGRDQHSEVFNNLLVAHELGHWLQEIAQRPLNRWQAEYEANRIMVAFWRDHPAAFPSAPTEKRLMNFVAQSLNFPSPMPDNIGMSAEEYFNIHFAEIEKNPIAYAGFQKMMVRQAIVENLTPGFCQVMAEMWPE